MRLIDWPEVFFKLDRNPIEGRCAFINRPELYSIMQKIPRLSFIIEQLLQQSARFVLADIAVGELILFNDEEIQSQWSRLVGDTHLSQTTLTIHRIPAEQQCMVCFEKYHPLNRETSCPHCGSVGAKILAGEEFYLESIK